MVQFPALPLSQPNPLLTESAFLEKRKVRSMMCRAGTWVALGTASAFGFVQLLFEKEANVPSYTFPALAMWETLECTRIKYICVSIYTYVYKRALAEANWGCVQNQGEEAKPNTCLKNQISTVALAGVVKQNKKALFISVRVYYIYT